MSLSEGRTQTPGRYSSYFLHKKHNWKILGVERNWMWKKPVQTPNTALEEKGKKRYFVCLFVCLKVALTTLNRILYSEYFTMLGA